jgi:cyanophycinase
MHCRNFAMLAALGALLAIGRPAIHNEVMSRAEELEPAKSASPSASERVATTSGADASNVLGLPAGAVTSGGSLVVCGGGALPDEVYDEFVKLAGGDKAKIVLIPSAHPYDSAESLRIRFNGWRQYPLNSFDFLHAVSREEVDAKDFSQPLEEATGVWFSGGAQGRLADLYKGTRVEELLLKVLERGGVIGGTSAGAAIMSQTMIRHGTSREAVLDAGFSLLSSAVVDQHFTERARHTRLLGALRENPEKIGLGVDEQTALIIRANTVRVLGQNRATVIVPAPNRTMSLHLLDSGEEAEIVRQDREEAPLKVQALANR